VFAALIPDEEAGEDVARISPVEVRTTPFIAEGAKWVFPSKSDMVCSRRFFTSSSPSSLQDNFKGVSK